MAKEKTTRSDLNKRAWQVLRKQILDRDQHCCAYCGREANTVDHIIPVSLGGDMHPTNLVAACRPCNSAKGGINRIKQKDPRFLESLHTPDSFQSISLPEVGSAESNPFRLRA
jgi:5-methylcytosine-specific restriction endonuclease McrA